MNGFRIREILAVAREAATAAKLSESQIKSVGLGIPGTTDSATGEIIYTCNLPFRNTPITPIFQREWNVPLFMDNDANCAALGELYAGAAKGCETALVVTIGTGIGGGFLSQGRLMTGCNGAALEIGHTVIEGDGRACACGRRGCWEQYASATGLKILTREEMKRCPGSLMWQISCGEISGIGGRTAFLAAKEGDEAAQRVVSKYLHYLATGLTNLVNIFQPERIILGGGVSHEEDAAFLFPLRELVAGEHFHGHGRQTELVKATLETTPASSERRYWVRRRLSEDGRHVH
jgi:glucokinase